MNRTDEMKFRAEMDERFFKIESSLEALWERFVKEMERKKPGPKPGFKRKTAKKTA